MAKLKKNAINQIMFTMVDKTDFATIETSLASNFTVKKFGVADNATVASAVITTVASLVKKVGSGVYKIALTASQCNYDQLLLRIAHASAATQVMLFQMETANDADLSDYLSKLQSRVPSLMATNSGMDSKFVKASISAASAVWAHTKGASALSLLSQLRVRADYSNVAALTSKVWTSTKGASAMSLLSQLRVRAAYSTISDLTSKIWSVKYSPYMNISAMNSTMAYRITGTSIISDIASQVWAHVKATSVLSRTSGIQSAMSTVSKIYSLTQPSQLNSVIWNTVFGGEITGKIIQSRVSHLVSKIGKSVASKSALSHFRSQANAYNSGVYISKSDMSDIRSAIAAGPTATITDADVSNIASRVWAVPYGAGGFVTAAAVGSMLRLRASTVSGIYSAVNAAATASDVASKVWAQPYASYQVASTFGSKMQAITATVGTADLTSIASRVWSNAIGTRVDSRIFQIRSTSSNVNSKLISLAGSRISGISDILSKVYAQTIGASDILSQLRVRAAWSTVSDMTSKIASRVWAANIDSASMVSNIASAVWAAHHASNSAVSSYGSRVGVIFALASNVNSKVISLAGSRISGISDMLSKVYALTSVMGTPSNVASAIWASAKGASVASLVSQLKVRIGWSTVSDLTSKIGAEIWGTPYSNYKAASTMGSILETLKGGRNSLTSDVASAVWAAHWNVHSAVSSFGSAYEQLIKKASYMSDVSSKTLSMMTGQSWLSNLASVVWAEASTISTIVARTGSATWANAKGISVLSRIPKFTASKSALSHVKSAISKAYSAIQPSQLNSVIWLTAGYGGSNVMSQTGKLASRVLKSVASKSAMSKVYSRTTTYGASGVHIAYSDMSDLRSAITTGPAAADTTSIAKAVWRMSYSLYGSNASSYGSMVRVLKTNIPGVLTTSNYSSKLWSDLRSQVGAITASVDNLSVASAVWAHSAATVAKYRLSNINSFVSNYASSMSDIASRAALMTWQTPYSNVTTASTFGSALGGRTSIASYIASAVWAHTIGARVDSRIVMIKSTSSNVNSKLVSFVGNMDSYMSDIASRVWGTTIGTRVDSRLKLTQSNVSDTYSMLSDALSAGVGLNASALSDIGSVVDARLDVTISDATALTAGGLKDRIRTMEWVLRNKMRVMKATGNTQIYKDDNSTKALSTAAALTSDATSVVRKRMA